MLPTLPESLSALRQRMTDTIIPALPEDEAFAKEQSSLVLATLDWLIDVHPHEAAYEAVESKDYRLLVDSLSRQLPEGASSRVRERAQAALESSSEMSPEDLPHASRVAANRELKSIVGELFSEILDHGAEDDIVHVKSALTHVAARQARREQAFYRMTGFPVDAEELGDVLDDQAAS